MPEIDPVILQLKADVDRYLTTLKSTTTKVDSLLGSQEKRARRLEQEMKRSSGAIAGHLRGLAATLGTYFTGRELAGLLDNFTRLQNSLRVAGLEGSQLKTVQEQLLATGARYGVQINDLADLFSRSSQVQNDLGASTEQLVSITNSAAAALRITGTSTEAARGALLGLTQALSSGIVRAEEFNQINEGGLRPILQVVAANEKWGGSVAKLRQAIVDGKVTSDEFFRSVLNGADVLGNKAAKATLTLSGGLTALTNALTVYFGEADKANGVSRALGEAFGLLADNLDTIIPAMAVVATAMGVRYVVAAGAATVSTIALGAAAGGTAAQMGFLGAATFALQARLAGAATTAEALGFAMAGLKTGLVATAILGLGAAIYYMADQTAGARDRIDELNDRTDQAEAKAAAMKERLEKAGIATDDLGRSADDASRGIDGFARSMDEAARRAKKLEDQVGLTRLKMLQLQVTEIQAQRQSIQYGLKGYARFFGQVTPEGVDAIRELNKEEVAALNRQENALRRQIAYLTRGMRAGVNVYDDEDGGGSSSGGGGEGGKRSRRAGPDAERFRQRFNDELAGISQRALSAQASVATSAEERAELELRSVELARIRMRADIENDRNYTAAQKRELLAAIDVATFEERAAIEFQRKYQMEREAADLAEAEYRAKDDALRLQYDLSDSQSERKRLALAMVELEQRYHESLLESVIASETASRAEKERAEIALQSLRLLRPSRVESAARANETPRERYLRDLNKTPEQINKALDEIKIDGLDALNDGLADAITGVRSLGDVFSDIADQIIADLLRIAIQKSIIGPLANALFSGGSLFGGGGGSFASSSGYNPTSLGLSSLAGGRASGGPVMSGQTYLVGEKGPELLRMGAQSGFVVPNHKLAAGGGAPVVQQFRFDLRGAVVTQDLLRQMNEIGARATVAGAQLGSRQAEGSIASRSRRRIPG